MTRLEIRHFVYSDLLNFRSGFLLFDTWKFDLYEEYI